MATKIRRITEQAQAIGEKLNSTYLTNIGQIIDAGCNTEKLSVTMIGNSRYLFEILTAIIESDSLTLFSSFIPKRYFQISVVYTESPQFKIYSQGGSAFVVTKETFQEELIKANESSIIWQGEIGINSTFLKTMNLNLVCSDKGFDFYDWQKILLQSDFTFLALDATQLLSMSEREFLSMTINNICNPERYAIIVSGMEMIQEVDKKDILEYVDSYLAGQNEVIAPVLPFGMEEQVTVIDFITRRIPSNTLYIRQNSHKQNSKYCIETIKKSILDIKDSLLESCNESADAIQIINQNSVQVDKKISGAERNIDIFVSGYIKNQFIRKIDEFSFLFNEDLKKEITTCNDMDEIMRQIPVYLKNAWQHFIEEQNVWLKNTVFSEMVKLSKMIEEDIKEIVSTINPNVLQSMKQYMPARFKYNAFLFPKRDKGDMLKYVDLGAMAMLLVSIPWAFIVFGVSQLIRFFFRDERLSAKKESLSIAAIESNNKLKNQIINQADIEIEKIADTLKEQVKEVYQTIFQEFNYALEMYNKNLQNSQELILYIDEVNQALVLEMETEIK